MLAERALSVPGTSGEYGDGCKTEEETLVICISQLWVPLLPNSLSLSHSSLWRANGITRLLSNVLRDFPGEPTSERDSLTLLCHCTRARANSRRHFLLLFGLIKLSPMLMPILPRCSVLSPYRRRQRRVPYAYIYNVHVYPLAPLYYSYLSPSSTLRGDDGFSLV